MTRRAPAFHSEGLYVGRYFTLPKKDEGGDGKVGGPIPYALDRHMLAFGPSGSGKGTGLLSPNLLSISDRSIIIIDPKAEQAAITAMYRHQRGDDVHLLDPFGVLKEITNGKPKYSYLVEHRLVTSAGFNPLVGLNPDSPNFYDDAAGIGEALIKINDHEPHWTESAQGLVVALVMWEVWLARKENRIPSLTNVRRLLTEAEDYDENTNRPKCGLRYTAALLIDKGGYEIASLAGRFINSNDEIASIISTADTQTRWLLSKPMRDDIEKPGIDFRRLKERQTTVYVVLPAERLRTHSVWLRLVIVSALRALYRPGGLPTTVFVDEMAALGYLGPLEDAFALVRGYGVQIVGFVQDLAQLQSLYKERSESFMANAGAIIGFAPNDKTTAEWMSWRSGIDTVLSKSLNDSGVSQTPSDQESSRPYFLPQELIGFRKSSGLLWFTSLKSPIPFFAPPWYNIIECEDRGLPNPYYRPKVG